MSAKKLASDTPIKLAVNNEAPGPSIDQGDDKEMSSVKVALNVEERRVPEDIEKLFREHHSLILQTAYRVTGNRMEAEDVLQILFLRLLHNQVAVDLRSPAQYLRRAAVNLALDQLRKRKKQVPLEAASRVSADRSSDPGTRQASSELADRLRSGLAQLHPKAAEMFVLRHVEGLSNTEIARLLGTSWGTVAVTLHRAHRRLRKDLSSYRGGRS